MGHLFGADTVDLEQPGFQQTWDDDAILPLSFSACSDGSDGASHGTHNLMMMMPSAFRRVCMHVMAHVLKGTA
jgi:hypothetical protein